MIVGSIASMLVKCASRTFFLRVEDDWIGDNPKETPAGGHPWGFSGAGSPAVGIFTSGSAAKIRTVSEMTELKYCPAGVRLGWDNET